MKPAAPWRQPEPTAHTCRPSPPHRPTPLPRTTTLSSFPLLLPIPVKSLVHATGHQRADSRAGAECFAAAHCHTSEETRELTSAAGRGGQARGAATASRRFGGGSGGELRSTATASCRPARAPTRPAAQPNPRGAYLESRRPAETRLGRCLASTRPEHRWARTPGPGRPPGARHRPRMAAWWLAASAEERRGTRALRRRGWQPAIV